MKKRNNKIERAAALPKGEATAFVYKIRFITYAVSRANGGCYGIWHYTKLLLVALVLG